MNRDQIPSTLGKLIDEFIIFSGEFERTPISILNQINYVLRRVGGLWVIYNSHNPIGYFFTEVVPTEYGTWACLIHQLYIKTSFAKRGVIHSVDGIIGAWARNNGATEVAFYTRRNPQAFNRLLGKNWNIDSFILKRAV